MSSESYSDFVWPDIQASDHSSDLQRLPLDSFVPQQDQGQHVQIQIREIQEASSSPPTMVQTINGENMNNNNSPSTPQQPMLPPGVVNPDAIIPQSRTYTCRICQVTFPNKSAVTVHSRSHTNHEGKPYKCGFCNKGFSTNFYLKQHERIHNGQKPYKCPMCDNSFKQLSHVQQHVRTHTGVRPYKCHWPGCGKAFLQQSHLKSHIARHSPKPSNGLRPYTCHWPDCGKSFAQISNLKSHIARHTPKSQKQQRKDSASAAATTTTVTQISQETEQVIAEMPGTQDLESDLKPSSFNLLPMSPDVIGQAAAAANIVPVQASGGLGSDCESICPFLCPGCSKLYVRESTFKKHLEECKTKLQMSITATAAALGIEPPPLPPPGTQNPFQLGDMTMDVSALAGEEPVLAESPTKKSRKSQKPLQAKLEPGIYGQHAQQQQVPILVQMPLNVGLDDCNQPLVDGEVDVKQEVMGIPLDGSGGDSSVMFKLPQHILNAVGEMEDGNNLSNNVNSYFSYSQAGSQLIDGGGLFSGQQLVTSSPVTSTQPVMLSGASGGGIAKSVSSTKADVSNPGHSTVNQAAISWQWDPPIPRMNFP